MAVFIYSIFAYIVGLVGQVWFILYLGDWDFLKTIHAPQQTSTPLAILVDVLLESEYRPSFSINGLSLRLQSIYQISQSVVPMLLSLEWLYCLLFYIGNL